MAVFISPVRTKMTKLMNENTDQKPCLFKFQSREIGSASLLMGLLCSFPAPWREGGRGGAIGWLPLSCLLLVRVLFYFILTLAVAETSIKLKTFFLFSFLFIVCNCFQSRFNWTHRQTQNKQQKKEQKPTDSDRCQNRTRRRSRGLLGQQREP